MYRENTLILLKKGKSLFVSNDGRSLSRLRTPLTEQSKSLHVMQLCFAFTRRFGDDSKRTICLDRYSEYQSGKFIPDDINFIGSSEAHDRYTDNMADKKPGDEFGRICEHDKKRQSKTKLIPRLFQVPQQIRLSSICYCTIQLHNNTPSVEIADCGSFICYSRGLLFVLTEPSVDQ